MIFVYTDKPTPRVEYAFKLFFTELLLTKVTITNSVEEFNAFEGVKINYSPTSLPNSLQFTPANLLFERNIDEQNIEVFVSDGLSAFFQVQNGIIDFDPFAAGFYLATRYEEYLPHKKDQFGRYLAEESLAYKNNFLETPLIDLWAERIKKIILSNYPQAIFPKKRYQYLPTVDIDNAYAYKEKGFFRTIGGSLRSAFKGNFIELKERWQVLLNKKKDPYNTFAQLLELEKNHNLSPIYFFLLADYNVNDKNVPTNSKKFQSLIKSIADYSQTGIHPSYTSNKEPWRIAMEKKRLEEIVHRSITKSRQHFLKLSFPETYRNLITAGITDEYTIGYASHLGFRASIATPFYFYDLDQEETTNLKVHPFQIMEVTLKYYLKLSPQEAIERITAIIESIKNVNGTCCTLWHNESLSAQKQWKGWENVYEKTIQLALP